MLSQKSKYALKALIVLAQEHGHGPVLISDIATRERIPRRFPTTFSLHLPVTRSVLRCLLVAIGGGPFALPLSHVDRVVRVRPDELVTVEGRACVRVDGETVGLVPAADVLGLPDGPVTDDAVHVVVLDDRGHRHGLEVEAFLGERDLVVRPLDPRLGSVPDVLAASAPGRHALSRPSTPMTWCAPSMRTWAAAGCGVSPARRRSPRAWRAGSWWWTTRSRCARSSASCWRRRATASRPPWTAPQAGTRSAWVTWTCWSPTWTCRA